MEWKYRKPGRRNDKRKFSRAKKWQDIFRLKGAYQAWYKMSSMQFNGARNDGPITAHYFIILLWVWIWLLYLLHVTHLGETFILHISIQISRREKFRKHTFSFFSLVHFPLSQGRSETDLWTWEKDLSAQQLLDTCSPVVLPSFTEAAF